MKLLVIDDAAEIRMMVRIALARRGGMSLVEAATGAEGLALAAAERPDVVLLDLHLPDMEGAAVAAALKATPETAAIPVIALSATLPPADRLAAWGCHGAVCKPFDLKGLVATILDQLAGPPLGFSIGRTS